MKPDSENGDSPINCLRSGSQDERASFFNVRAECQSNPGPYVTTRSQSVCVSDVRDANLLTVGDMIVQ